MGAAGAFRGFVKTLGALDRALGIHRALITGLVYIYIYIQRGLKGRIRVLTASLRGVIEDRGL